MKARGQVLAWLTCSQCTHDARKPEAFPRIGFGIREPRLLYRVTRSRTARKLVTFQCARDADWNRAGYARDARATRRLADEQSCGRAPAMWLQLRPRARRPRVNVHPGCPALHATPSKTYCDSRAGVAASAVRPGSTRQWRSDHGQDARSRAMAKRTIERGTAEFGAGPRRSRKLVMRRPTDTLRKNPVGRESTLLRVRRSNPMPGERPAGEDAVLFLPQIA